MKNSLLLKRTPSLLLVIFAMSVSSVVIPARAQSQQKGQADERRQAERINEEKLTSLMSAAGISVDNSNRFTPGSTYQSLQLQLTTSSKSVANSSLAQDFSTSVKSSERRTGELPRHRSIELSSQHLVVVTVDNANRLRWWSL